jgi:flagellar hook-associated protein 3 FlgL
MVAVIGNTQYATQLDITRSIRLLNLQLAQQNQQLGSGRYADGLIGVSERALELGQLKSELGSVNNYKGGVQIAKNRVDLYATTIEEIIDIATDAQETMIKNRDSFFAATSAPRVQAESILDRIGGLLQTRDADRYIFAGTNYTQNPISGAISQLEDAATPGYIYPANAVPAAYTQKTDATVYPSDDYDAVTSFYIQSAPVAPATYANYFDTNSTTLYSDDNEEISYGVSAAEDGFQTLIDAVIRFRDSTQDIATNPDMYQQRVDDARTQLNTALTQLKSIASRNGYKQQQIKEVMERHDRTIDVLRIRVGAIENVDIGEVSINIKNLQTSLEASYVITRDTLQLSLVQYLR